MGENYLNPFAEWQSMSSNNSRVDSMGLIWDGKQCLRKTNVLLVMVALFADQVERGIDLAKRSN